MEQSLAHETSSAEPRLDPAGQNLHSVLNYLYHNQLKTYEELKGLLHQIVPGIGDLHLPQIGNQIWVKFRDPDAPSNELELKSLGTGVEQLLMTLVVGLMGDGLPALSSRNPRPIFTRAPNERCLGSYASGPRPDHSLWPPTHPCFWIPASQPKSYS